VSEVARFVLTGALNTLVGFGIYTALVLVGLDVALALLAATVLGVLFNFFSFGRITFRRPAMDRLPRFVAIYAVIYVFNLALLWGAQRTLGVGPVVGQFLCLFVVAPAAYLLLKHKVYGDSA